MATLLVPKDSEVCEEVVSLAFRRETEPEVEWPLRLYLSVQIGREADREVAPLARV